MIPFVDLQTQYRGIESEIMSAIQRTLQSGQFVLGPEVAAFEREFAAFSEAAFGVGVNSGTSALHLALLAAGIGEGDEVITVPFTFVATVAAIRYAGATPVFVDIDPASYTMDVHQLERALTPNTKAIIPVHLYGQPVDMDPLLGFARHHRLTVIEDAAQAHGARYKGRAVGSLGDYGCFSFYPGKNLGAYGEGGMVVTNCSDAADRLRLLRDWGARQKYHHDLLGFNYRMEGIQGAILRVKLKYLAEWNQKRRDVAARYSALMQGVVPGLPRVMPYAEHVFHIYAVRVEERETVQRVLQSKDIQTGIHYPIPVHLQKGYTSPSSPAGSFPAAEAAAREVLSLPLFPEMSAHQVETVVTALAACTRTQKVAA